MISSTLQRYKPRHPAPRTAFLLGWMDSSLPGLFSQGPIPTGSVFTRLTQASPSVAELGGFKHR